MKIHHIEKNVKCSWDTYPFIFLVSYKNKWKMLACYYTESSWDSREDMAEFLYLNHITNMENSININGYCDLFYSNCGQPEERKLFEWLDNGEEWFNNHYYNQPISELFKLQEDDFSVIELSKPKGLRGEGHYKISLPNELWKTGRCWYPKSDMGLFTQETKRKREYIKQHTYFFNITRAWRSETRYAVSTNEKLDVNDHDGCRYGRVDDYIIDLQLPITKEKIYNALLCLEKQVQQQEESNFSLESDLGSFGSFRHNHLEF